MSTRTSHSLDLKRVKMCSPRIGIPGFVNLHVEQMIIVTDLFIITNAANEPGVGGGRRTNEEGVEGVEMCVQDMDVNFDAPTQISSTTVDMASLRDKLK